MFQDTIADAVMMLVVIFWVMLAAIIVWGVFWARSKKKQLS
ncbi:MAG TPA: hypothetical protein VMT26_04355 [Candidatus Bathyarchaeia archaeon]|jgi:hypothetical protein|nr:hypothetical protein [Candidatus Bathyarchaeia archaeon]